MQLTILFPVSILVPSIPSNSAAFKAEDRAAGCEDGAKALALAAKARTAAIFMVERSNPRAEANAAVVVTIDPRDLFGSTSKLYFLSVRF
jgi:hypothetical protein